MDIYPFSVLLWWSFWVTRSETPVLLEGRLGCLRELDFSQEKLWRPLHSSPASTCSSSYVSLSQPADTRICCFSGSHYTTIIMHESLIKLTAFAQVRDTAGQLKIKIIANQNDGILAAKQRNECDNSLQFWHLTFLPDLPHSDSIILGNLSLDLCIMDISNPLYLILLLWTI